MESSILRAGVIAIVGSVVTTLLFAVLTGSSVRYREPMDPSEFYSLTYEEQIAWREKNEIRTSGFAYLSEVMDSPFMRWKLFWTLAGLFILVFFSCVAMALWERRRYGT